MKNIIYPLLILLFTFSASGQSTKKVKGKSDFQRELNEKFSDKEKSPLTKKDFRKFKGLEFFPIESSYKITADFEKDLKEEFVGFPTTTSRVAPYKKYGTIHFSVNGKEQKLTVYKSTNAWGNPAKYANHLFLPYKDTTNGESTYSGGRYLDLSTLDIKENNKIIIDFNKSYNPYCAYSNRYSCPKVPDENVLTVAINAGVKAFKK